MRLPLRNPSFAHDFAPSLDPGRLQGRAFLAIAAVEPKQRRGLLAAVACILAVSLPSVAQIVLPPPLGSICERFNGATLNGWGGTASAPNVTSSIQNNGQSGAGDFFARFGDLPNASAIGAGPTIISAWNNLQCCGTLCYDLRIMNDGNASQSTLIVPSFIIKNSLGQAFRFLATGYGAITEPGGSRPGWHRICAPIRPLSGGLLPSSSVGSWAPVAPAVVADWPAVACSVVEISFPVDFTSFQTEIVDIDNVCLSPCCKVGVMKRVRNNTGVAANCVEILVKGSFNSVLSNTLAPFTSFTITPVGPNTKLTWCGPNVAPGGIVTVGFERLAFSMRILGVFWSVNGSVVGCSPQFNGMCGVTTTGNGHVYWGNQATSCQSDWMYVQPIRMEFYDIAPSLASMTLAGTRTPLSVVNGPFPLSTLAPGEFGSFPLPLLPINAKFLLLIANVGPHLIGSTAGPTDDFMLLPLIPQSDLYEVNDAGLSLDFNGLQSDGFRPAATILGYGEVSTLNVASANIGSPWDLAIVPAGLVAADEPGALVLASGEIINLDASHPGLQLVFGGFFGGPFPGSLALPIMAPCLPVTFSLQALILSPASPTGFEVSQGVELTSSPGQLPTVPTADDAAVIVPMASLWNCGLSGFPVFGQSYSHLHLSTNGRLTFGTPDTDYSPTISEALTNPPFVGAWGDFDPSSGGAIAISALPGGGLHVGWNAVPWFGQAATANSFEIDLIPGGNIAVSGLQGLNASSLAAQNLFLGLSRGNSGPGATDPGPRLFGGGSFGQTTNATDMIYEFGQGNTPAQGINVLTFSPIGNDYAWATF